MREVSLYIHIPFCVRKCLYCDFLSAPGSEEAKEVYTKRLCREIQSYQGHHLGSVKSVFLGGGTPTCMKPAQIERMMQAVRDTFMLQEGAEITIECNPGTADKENLHFLRSLGIDRISIGTQSASDSELQKLGRIHTWKDAEQTYEWSRAAGFTNINMDLMSGLPGQRVESFEASLKRVIALGPEHVSVYSLIIEEGTPFYERYGEANALREKTGNRVGELISEDEERQMVHLTGQLLQDAGYTQYEISNYAKPGYESVHNCVYWQRGNYLGLGLGASGFIDQRRYHNTDILQEYIQKEDIITYDMQLSIHEQMEEFLFLGLRMNRGISISKFERDYDISIDEIYPGIVRKLMDEGLLETEGDWLRLTAMGRDLGNRVFAEFLLDDDA